jgi:hypothetical protein
MTFKLYHYFDRENGPFRNLSQLTREESEEVSSQIRLKGTSFASRRLEDYRAFDESSKPLHAIMLHKSSIQIFSDGRR